MKRTQILSTALLAVLMTVLCGGEPASANAGQMAVPTWQPIYVDGTQVQLEAYNINGNNFVKLRDIGKAVGMNVYWADGVQIDTTMPYTGEAPARKAPVSSISIGSYKGDTLPVRERSGLMIDPSGSYAVTSSDSSILSVELVSGNWVAVGKSSGTATVTAISANGSRGELTITVTEAIPIDLDANMDARLEMLRLINAERRANGVAELPVEDSLMDAAQDCSAQRMIEHGRPQWETIAANGWPHGGRANLTSFVLEENQPGAEIAAKAVARWMSSPGHRETLLAPNGDCVGTGIAIYGRMAYCFMIVGNYDSRNPF